MDTTTSWGPEGRLVVPFLGFPIVRTIVFVGLYRGPSILGNHHVRRKVILPGPRAQLTDATATAATGGGPKAMA